MAGDENSTNGRDSSSEYRWKSIDKLCSFRESFFSIKYPPPVPTVGKSGCIRNRAVIKPPRRIAYTEIIDYPGLIGTSWTVRKPAGYISFAFFAASSCVFFCHSVAASPGVEDPFLALRNLMKNKQHISPWRTVALSDVGVKPISFA